MSGCLNLDDHRWAKGPFILACQTQEKATVFGMFGAVPSGFVSQVCALCGVLRYPIEEVTKEEPSEKDAGNET